MALLAFALLLAQLVAVPAPNGGTIDTDPALWRALEMLASLDADGRPLVQAFADGGVRIVAGHVANLGRLALSEPRRRTATVAAEAAQTSPRTIPTILALEA